MFPKSFKTLGYMKIIVLKIPPGGGRSKTISIPWPKLQSLIMIQNSDLLSVST